MRFSTVSVLALATLAVACGGAPTSKAPASGQSVAAGDFGVPECDEYFRKYLACVDAKVPEAARGMVKQSLDRTRDEWKKVAATPQGRSGLAAACTQATATAKQAMTAYGCQW